MEEVSRQNKFLRKIVITRLNLFYKKQTLSNLNWFGYSEGDKRLSELEVNTLVNKDVRVLSYNSSQEPVPIEERITQLHSY